jgi:hypothetical protein
VRRPRSDWRTKGIAELRKEIAEIQSANHLASISIPYQDREAMK